MDLGGGRHMAERVAAFISEPLQGSRPRAGTSPPRAGGGETLRLELSFNFVHLPPPPPFF